MMEASELLQTYNAIILVNTVTSVKITRKEKPFTVVRLDDHEQDKADAIAELWEKVKDLELACMQKNAALHIKDEEISRLELLLDKEGE